MAPDLCPHRPCPNRRAFVDSASDSDATQVLSRSASRSVLRSVRTRWSPCSTCERPLRDHRGKKYQQARIVARGHRVRKRGAGRAGYEVSEHSYSLDGQKVSNLEAILAGSEKESGTLVVGAHYDGVAGTVGADDNATGVAAILELARMLQGSRLRKNIRFVLFANDEPPFFQTDVMGSLVYARQLKRDHIEVSAMISLEMLGYYSDAPSSQKYPALLGWLYPSRGDFLGFVGKSDSPDLVRRAVRRFRETTDFPSEGVAAPVEWPGVGWSDHWSFWQANYPAIMITDTAIFRNPYYHTPNDTPDKLDFPRMARVVEGVRRVVETLASNP